MSVERINAEMQKHPEDKTLEVVGHYVLDKLAAGAKIGESKTIAGAISAMKDVARKSAKDGCGCLTDEEGFAIVDKYFGFDIVSKVPEKKTELSLEDFF